MAACTSKHRQVCTHCGIRWKHFPKLFASFVCDFIFKNVFVPFQLTAGLPPQLEGWLCSVTPTHFQIPLKEEQTFKSVNIQSSFINVFLKITSDIVVAALSPHISSATVWLLKYLKKSGGQASGCRAARLDFCWWNWTWSLLLWCWLWGISILLNKASGSLFFYQQEAIICSVTWLGSNKGGGREVRRCLTISQSFYC